MFASADTLTWGQLVPVRDQALRLDPAPYRMPERANGDYLALPRHGGRTAAFVERRAGDSPVVAEVGL